MGSNPVGRTIPLSHPDARFKIQDARCEMSGGVAEGESQYPPRLAPPPAAVPSGLGISHPGAPRDRSR